MSEGGLDGGRRDSEIRQHVLTCLRKRERRALFVTELATALRKAHGISVSAMEQALAALAVDWTVVMRDHYCAAPYLEGADLTGRRTGRSQRRQRRSGERRGADAGDPRH